MSEGSKTPPVFTSLGDVYGASCKAMDVRFKNIKTIFEQRYGCNPTFFARAPGRVNLIGEHIDYSGYAVLPMALEQDIIIAVARNDKGILQMVNTNRQFSEFSVDAAQNTIDGKSWYHYVLCGHKGLIEYAGLKNPIGMHMLVDGNIPKSAGLSSSSALVCCAALATMYANELNFDKYELADICTKCERYIGTEGGGMDQSISFLAERGTAKLIEFNPLKATDVQLPEGACFVIANCLVEITKSETAGTHFNVRVAECRLAAKVLALKNNLEWRNFKKLGDVQNSLAKTLPEMVSIVDKVLHPQAYTRTELCSLLQIEDDEFTKDCLTPSTAHVQTFHLYQRAKHVYEEANRVWQFKQCASENKHDALQTLGKLMNDSHTSCSQQYQCSCEELDCLTALNRSAGALGSRLTGAGWGGCTVSLVPANTIEEFLHKVEREYYSGVPAREKLVQESLFATQPGSGAAILKNI